MSIKLKEDVLQLLKNAGYNTSILRDEKIMGESAIQNLRNGEIKTMKTLDAVCRMLNCQPGELLEYEKDLKYKLNEDNTKKKLLRSLELNNSKLNSEWQSKVIEIVKTLDIPDLENESYTVGWSSNGFNLIKQTEYWNEKMNCLSVKDECVIDNYNFDDFNDKKYKKTIKKQEQ